MGTPVYRQQGVMLLHSVAPHIPTCHARMFECAAAHASGGNRQLYALFIDEFVTEAESHPELSASSILQRALRPLQQSAPASAHASAPASAHASADANANASSDASSTRVTSSTSGLRAAPTADDKANKASATSEHKLVCPMCRSTRESVIPFEKQRRSADEPAHQYAQCLNDDCRHVWLVSS